LTAYCFSCCRHF